MLAGRAALAWMPLGAVVMVFLPFLAALVLRPLGAIAPRLAAALGPLVVLVCGLLALGLVVNGAALPGPLALGAAGAPLALLLRLDQFSLVLALVSLALVLLGWTRGEDHPEPARARAAMLLLAGGLCGLALAGDAVTGWLFLEVCALAGGALLLLGGTLRSLTAMLRFVRWSAVGSALGMAGLGFILTVAALAADDPARVTLGRLGFGLLVLGVGVKVALFPFNGWMLAATEAAGARVMALLTGILPGLALLNLARVLATHPAATAGAEALIGLGLVATLAGALGMWRARAFPTFLVALSLAAMGAVALGFSLPGPAGPFVALVLMLHFLLIHSALFVLAHRWRGRTADLAGIAWRLPLTAAVLMLLAASLVGVPPLPGFWVKLMLVLSLAEQDGGLILVVLLGLLLAMAVEAGAWLRLLRLLYAPAVAVTAEHWPRADRLPELLRPGWLARAYFLWVAALVLLVTLSIAPVAQGLNRLLGPTLGQPTLALPASGRGRSELASGLESHWWLQAELAWQREARPCA
jgi:formate hydrogenlyase subunit 3/multisubunit Na+/H+ antiporter MnhD subunit